ncbi:MAG: 4-(cytidine 5'-diphospho)-2-C-methyl-D-erythritol kinase [Hydrotalea sp.]|nr:4-(cytidine 5'-diphospho)-2-C-methyl-D-erythritol kinase [Hydrotalea sp.]
MVIFPNCKINLGLTVDNKRPDGYHNISTVFLPIPLHDILEIVPSKSSIKIQFEQSGRLVDGKSMDNLCVKAAQLLQNLFPEIPPIEIYLHKNIPMGAGLGGGSSDAAHTLLALNELFKLNLSKQELIQLSLQLGSDCPFFIENKPCFATGRGEIMFPIEVNLKSYHILLINPNIHISTAWAFKEIAPGSMQVAFKEILQEEPIKWRNKLINHFEEVVCVQFPEIRYILDLMYEQGAEYAAMTGTGSTIYGIFKNAVEPFSSVPSHYFQFAFEVKN